MALSPEELQDKMRGIPHDTPQEIVEFTRMWIYARMSATNHAHAGPVDTYLEIGTWRGASLFWTFARHQPSYAIAIDAYPEDALNTRRTQRSKQCDRKIGNDAGPDTDEIPKHVQRLWDEYFPHISGGLKVGPSTRHLPELLPDHHQHFDLVYVDGSHLGPDVYFDAAIAGELVKPGGHIIFDDWSSRSPRHGLRLAVDTFARVNAERFDVVKQKRGQIVLKRNLKTGPREYDIVGPSLLAPEEHTLVSVQHPPGKGGL